MNKMLSFLLLGAGVVLIVYGLAASDSIASDFSRFFTGSPTDKSIWMLAGGGLLAILGMFGVLRGSRATT